MVRLFRFSLTKHVLRKAKAAGVIALLLTGLLLCNACRQRGESWRIELVEFSNNVVVIYWIGELWENSADLPHRVFGKSTKGITETNYLATEIDLLKGNCRESTITANRYATVLKNRENCLTRFVSMRLPEETRIVDANCQGDWVLTRRLMSSVRTAINDTITNVLPEVPDYFDGPGAINEKGDCVFFPMSAGFKRTGGLLRFAVFKNGVWWSTSVSGPMPSVTDTNVIKTLSIAKLTEIDK